MHTYLYTEQFVQGRLDRALILLGLAVFRAPLCLRCTWWKLVLYVKNFHYIRFFTFYSVLSLWNWPLIWKTVILQCYYTVGWVI